MMVPLLSNSAKRRLSIFSLILVLLATLAPSSSSGDDPEEEFILSMSYPEPRCDGNDGCMEGMFCNYNDDTSKVCEPCPKIIDDCQGHSSKESATLCRQMCDFGLAGEACSSNNSACFPGLAFCDYTGGAAGNDGGVCRLCRKNLTECLTEFNTGADVETQQNCLSCQFQCSFEMEIKVVANLSSSNAARDNQVLSTVVENVVVAQGSRPAAGSTLRGRLTECLIDSLDVCQQNVSNSFCLVDVVQDLTDGRIHDDSIRACERGGGVGVLVYNSGYNNETRIPRLQIRLGATAIPVAAISYETATSLREELYDMMVFGTTTSQKCRRTQRCADSVPCAGSSNERPMFCGSDRVCYACPINDDTGDVDPFRCFDDDNLYDQQDVESCVRDCGKGLSLASWRCIKFCPKEVKKFAVVPDESEQCHFCNEHVQFPDREIRAFGGLLCWQMQSLFEIVPFHENSQNCQLAQKMNYICGCSSSPGYGGANTHIKKAVLAWLPRVMAMLSFLGSTLIISDVLRLRSRRRLVFNQLMASLSCFDLIGATAYAFTTLPVRATDYFYGSAGNEATCIAQGFFIQVGTISCYKNVSLAIYYYLVIAKGWSEHRIHKIRIWLFSIPVLLGLAFAFAGIPFYDNMILWCNNAAPFWPDIPVAVAIFCATVIMAIVCVHVHMQEKVSARWRDPAGTMASQNNGDSATRPSVRTSAGHRNQLSSKVRWQAFWYLMAFYVTWPPYLALQYSWASGKALSNYGLILAAGTMAPLQGFWNFLVYIRPRYVARSSTRVTTYHNSTTSANHLSSTMRQALAGIRSAFSSERASGSNARDSRWKSHDDSDACGATPVDAVRVASAQAGLSQEQSEAPEEQVGDSRLQHDGRASGQS